MKNAITLSLAAASVTFLIPGAALADTFTQVSGTSAIVRVNPASITAIADRNSGFSVTASGINVGTISDLGAITAVTDAVDLTGSFSYVGTTNTRDTLAAVTLNSGALGTLTAPNYATVNTIAAGTAGTAAATVTGVSTGTISATGATGYTGSLQISNKATSALSSATDIATVSLSSDAAKLEQKASKQASLSLSGNNIDATAASGEVIGANLVTSTATFDRATANPYSISKTTTVVDGPASATIVAAGTTTNTGTYSTNTLTQAGVIGNLAGTVTTPYAGTVTAGGAGTTGELSVVRSFTAF